MHLPISMGSKQACRTVIEQARDAWVARDANASHSCLLTGTDRARTVVAGTSENSRRSDPFRSAVFRCDIRRIIIEDNQAAVEWHYERH